MRPPLPDVIRVGRALIVPVAINALDGGRRARLAVEQPVAMHVRLEMAIRALHPAREVRVLEVNRLRKLHRVVVEDLVVLEIEQVAAILLEHRTNTQP